MSTTKAKFAAFILSHGRPNSVHTYDSLRAAGYTGDIFIIIDNEDATAPDYYKRFGNERVIMFDKAAVARTFDTADTQNDRRSIVYARNAAFDIARNLGLTYFIQLDDDYKSWSHRWVTGEQCHTAAIRSMDEVLSALVTFLDDTGAATVAMAQGGDLLGGTYLKRRRMLLRKAMNTLVFRTDRPIQFVGRINEDVNTYVTLGSRGHLFFTTILLDVTQTQTQQTAGGMTDIYRNSGTYTKSFYTVMMHPSSVRVEPMKTTKPRLHHNIRWQNTVPMIISDKHRKSR